MRMIPVSSSNLESVGYENGTLYVSFHGGRLYSYDNVPAQVYHELLDAPSKGQYLAYRIKGVYPYRRIY